MERTKKIVIVSHCILNFNSKVEEISVGGNVAYNLIKYLLNKEYGIIQLPCPEISIYGIKRWGHVKEQFDTPYYRKHCRSIFGPILEQIEDYINNGYEIKALIGIDGSPSCGLNLTCSSSIYGGTFKNKTSAYEKINDVKVINEPGVFIEEIHRILNEKNIKINIIAIDESDEELTMKRVKQALK